MNTEQKLFDLAFLEQINDENFIEQVIVLFLKDTVKDLDDMNCALEASAVDTIFKAAHKLKSSTGMLQAKKLYNILEEIENTAKAGLVDRRLIQLVQTARFEFELLKSALEIYLSGIKSVA